MSRQQLLSLTLIIIFSSTCIGYQKKFDINATLEFDEKEILSILYPNCSSEPSLWNSALVADTIYKAGSNSYLQVFLHEFEKSYPNRMLASYFASGENHAEIDYSSSNQEVINSLKNARALIIQNCLTIINDRLIRFGIQSNQVELHVENSNINISVRSVKDKAGIDEVGRIRSLLTARGKLEFWETYDNGELIDMLYKADKMIQQILAENEEMTPTEKHTINSVSAPTAEEPLSLLEQVEKESATIEISEESNREKYPLLSILYPRQDPSTHQPIAGATIGNARQTDTATINSYLNRIGEKFVFPRNTKFLWSFSPISDGSNNPTDLYSLYAVKTKSSKCKAALEGDVVVSAKTQFDSPSGTAYVLMNMNSAGTKEWEILTRNNIGRSLAIVVDDRVYSCPTVMSEITGGSSQISGSFSFSEADDLANILNSSPLPLQLKLTKLDSIE